MLMLLKPFSSNHPHQLDEVVVSRQLLANVVQV